MVNGRVVFTLDNLNLPGQHVHGIDAVRLDACQGVAQAMNDLERIARIVVPTP